VPMNLATQSGHRSAFTGVQRKAAVGGSGFYNADYTLTDQLAYLRRLRKVTESGIGRIRGRQRNPG